MKNFLLVAAGFIGGLAFYAAVYNNDVDNDGEVIYENDDYIVKAGANTSCDWRFAKVEHKKTEK